MSVDIEKKYPDGIPSEIMSDYIWRAFRKADEQWCCKSMREAKRQGARAYGLKGKQQVQMMIAFCPLCGRKLMEGK